MVVSVGIDVSKDKHDCFIVSSEGEVLADAFIIPNTMDGFHYLLQRIRHCTAPQDKINTVSKQLVALRSSASDNRLRRLYQNGSKSPENQGFPGFCYI